MTNSCQISSPSHPIHDAEFHAILHNPTVPVKTRFFAEELRKLHHAENHIAPPSDSWGPHKFDVLSGPDPTGKGSHECLLI